MPFARIRQGGLRRVAIPVVVVYLTAWLPFLLVGEPDQMVRLQLAGSPSKAREIVGGWSPSEVADLTFLLGVDFVHLLAYGVLLALAAVWAGRRFTGRAARWGPVIAWLGPVAALFDVVENTGTLVMIRGETGSPLPAITTTAATAKYTMFLVVAAYVVVGLVAGLRRARTTRSAPEPRGSG